MRAKNNQKSEFTQSLIFVLFSEKPRFRFHHLLKPGCRGQSPLRALALSRWQEDRPQTRDTKVKKQGEQNKEDLCRRSQPGNVFR